MPPRVQGQVPMTGLRDFSEYNGGLLMPDIREQRIALGKRRMANILRKHAVSTMRTLEQKISDAGPLNQRVDPHLLTEARDQLQNQAKLIPFAARRRAVVPPCRGTLNRRAPAARGFGADSQCHSQGRFRASPGSTPRNCRFQGPARPSSELSRISTKTTTAPCTKRTNLQKL